MSAPLLENMLPYTRTLGKETSEKIASLPPGVIGVASGFLGRYREFDWCLDNLWSPPGTLIRWSIGVDVCHNFNDMCRYLIERPEMQWLWILGDDHLFTQDLLLNLMARDLDIVVPLCLRRNGDFSPVFNRGKDGGYATISESWDLIKGKSGLMPWDGTCGNAGMLIRRKVLEGMVPPWFRAGQLSPEYSSPDLYFCQAAQEKEFKIIIDLDNPIGHMDHMGIWPRRDENGEWHVDFRSV
jgi:hypothetical protein